MDPTADAPLASRTARRVRWFKRIIVLATLAVSAGLIAASGPARFHARNAAEWTRREVVRLVTGLEPDRARIDADWARRRAHSIEQTRDVLRRFYEGTTEEMRELFRAAGMDPEHGLIRYGRGDQAFLISPQVFELDDRGRSYRMRPNQRSIWLRQITLHNGPFGLFQVVDEPAIRAAASRAGAIVDEHSAQTTNSWGLRGPEPDPEAPVRGVVLGDSFMLGMFNGDEETPPHYLARRLEERWKDPVSIANTGHIGYSPEQYYYSLVEYGERMRPHFVVVSVCPNDFGDGMEVLAGDGDWYDEAAYWLEQIQSWCRTRSVALLLVAVPTHVQIENRRKEGGYPGRISDLFRSAPVHYLNPTDAFIDEHLRIRRRAMSEGRDFARSDLYNHAIHDNHFSPAGADLWGKVVADRLGLILETTGPRRILKPDAPAPADGP
jgi:hypothetical protein